MSIFIIIHICLRIGNAIPISTKIVACFDCRADTPFGGQVQDIIVVFILFIVYGSFVAKILCQCISKVPGISVFIKPANQGIAWTRSIHHISGINGCSICRPKIAALRLVHNRVISTKIKLHIVCNACPDCINTQCLRRHSLIFPFNRLVCIMFSRHF